MASNENFSAALSIEEFPSASVQSLQLDHVLVLTVTGRVSYRNAPELRLALLLLGCFAEGGGLSGGEVLPLWGETEAR